LKQYFPYIRVQNGTDPWQLPHEVSSIMANPPFASTIAKEDCNWASGRVSQAAVFLDAYLHQASPGSNVYAILPDVLRTGSRYARWRKMVGQRARDISVKIIGRFDDITDVDVFFLELKVTDPGDARSDTTWGFPPSGPG